MSDLALFAIFENGHIPADQVYQCTYYFYEFNLKNQQCWPGATQSFPL